MRVIEIKHFYCSLQNFMDSLVSPSSECVMILLSIICQCYIGECIMVLRKVIEFFFLMQLVILFFAISNLINLVIWCVFYLLDSLVQILRNILILLVTLDLNLFNGLERKISLGVGLFCKNCHFYFCFNFI